MLYLLNDWIGDGVYKSGKVGGRFEVVGFSASRVRSLSSLSLLFAV